MTGELLSARSNKMDVKSAIDRMYVVSLQAPKSVPVLLDNARLNEAVEHCIAGQWNTEDLVEAQVDELSTAASVGSGAAQVLRMSDEKEKETLEKILAQFEGYRRKMGLTEVRTKDIYQFLDALNLPERIVETFVDRLKSRIRG